MLREKRKRNIFVGFFLTPYFFTLICLVILAVVVLPVYKNARQRYEVDQEILALQKEINDLETSNSDLKKLKTYLESDQFAEKEARMNMGLKKEGEQVAIVKEGNEAVITTVAGDSDDNSGQNKNSNPWKWWNYFFK